MEKKGNRIVKKHKFMNYKIKKNNAHQKNFFNKKAQIQNKKNQREGKLSKQRKKLKTHLLAEN